MSQPAAASASGTGSAANSQLPLHASTQAHGQLDDAGNTKIDGTVVLAVAEAVALVMDQQLLQCPLAYPAVPFDDVSALLQMKGILLDLQSLEGIWATLVTGQPQSVLPPLLEKDIPSNVHKNNSLTDTVFAMYSKDIDRAAREMLSAPDRALSCTPLVGGLVGPRPPKHRSPQQLYAQQHMLVSKARLVKRLQREPTPDELQASLKEGFEALDDGNKQALVQASAKEAFLRARECLLWEAEAAEAANIMQLCVQMRAAAIASTQAQGSA